MTGIPAATLLDEVEKFIRQRFAVPQTDTRFTREVDLWDNGYVDSLGVVELIAFLEQRVGVKLPTSVLFDPEFKTIEGIARLLGAG
jgi:acyl carrier protein